MDCSKPGRWLSSSSIEDTQKGLVDILLSLGYLVTMHPMSAKTSTTTTRKGGRVVMRAV